MFATTRSKNTLIEPLLFFQTAVFITTLSLEHIINPLSDHYDVPFPTLVGCGVTSSNRKKSLTMMTTSLK
jgi:hypothetical protein